MFNDTPNPPLKRCAKKDKCINPNGSLLPATSEYFSSLKCSLDGLDYCCKACKNEHQRNWRKNNKDKVKASNARMRSKPGHKEQEKEIWKKYYIENAERLKTQSREHKQRYPEVVRETRKRFRLKHADEIKRQYKLNPPKRKRLDPEVTRLLNQRRLTRKRSLPNTLTKKQWLDCLVYFDNRCAVCGRPQGLWHTLAMDHWTPMSSPNCPGTIATNIICLCHGVDGCNNQKRNINAAEWLTNKYGKRKASKILKRIQTYFDSLEGD